MFTSFSAVVSGATLALKIWLRSISHRGGRLSKNRRNTRGIRGFSALTRIDTNRILKRLNDGCVLRNYLTVCRGANFVGELTARRHGVGRYSTVAWRVITRKEKNSRKCLKAECQNRMGRRVFADQSTFSGSFSDPCVVADNAGFRASKIGLRRCSCSRALTALSRSRNQVFSGQLQLPSTSE